MGLLELDFLRILPGHGRSARFDNREERDAAFHEMLSQEG